jgi:DNA polymerase elongation subunit (family B)
VSVPINITASHIFFAGGTRQDIRTLWNHRPYFLVLCPDDEKRAESMRKRVTSAVKEGGEDGLSDAARAMVDEVGSRVELYDSFANPGAKLRAFRVYSRHPRDVPAISDDVFFRLGFPTAEHDVPYHQRALADLASEDRLWMFDTGGKREKLKVLVYDIETTKFSEEAVEDAQGKFRNITIDMVGFDSFELSFESSHDLDREEFTIELVDAPTDWKSADVNQLLTTKEGAEGKEQELQNLLAFTREARKHDVIAGHNLFAFDNIAVRERIEELLRVENRRGAGTLSDQELGELEGFVRDFTKKDRIFNFGQPQSVINFFPTTFDTYYAARRFYFFLHNFSLKEIAPVMGVEIPDRIKLDYSQLDVNDPRTQKYHRQDVQEQLGITQLLIQQALPLAFATCLPFEEIWPAGTTRLWDHMAMIRAARRKKVFPPIHRAGSIAKMVSTRHPPFTTREEIAARAREEGPDRLDDTFRRVVKYGPEMPGWIEYAHLIHAKSPQRADKEEGAEDDEEVEEMAGSYHLPGGLTIHPDDPKVSSQMVLYWSIVTADVGAMYPTILMGRNVGADTVTLCRAGQEPDDWIWLKRAPPDFLDPSQVVFRDPGPDEPYAGGEGKMIGVRMHREPGMIALAMQGVLKIIQNVKKRMKETDRDPHASEADKFRWKMVYASLKALRNAGTHGILAAPGISAREFNLMAGAEITTIGQEILDDVDRRLREAGARVVYGDTDGIDMATARGCPVKSAIPRVLGIPSPPQDSYISSPDEIKRIISTANVHWRRELDYEDFDLEIEEMDAALFVKHKNYLYWELLGDKLKMTTKGNNFKGSDKPNLARKALDRIMKKVLADNLAPWAEEDESRARLRESIVRHTEDAVKEIDVGSVPMDDLILIQTVRPPNYYKEVGKGKESVFSIRSKAIEKILGRELRTSLKMKFVVCKKPLEGIPNPKSVKAEVKPLDYMWPIDHYNGRTEIDLEWYRLMIRSYIYGAFGLQEEKRADQRLQSLMTFDEDSKPKPPPGGDSSSSRPAKQRGLFDFEKKPSS